MMDQRSLCALVDHTLLKPEATEAQIAAVAAEGAALGVASVCVNSYWVSKVVTVVAERVRVCSVIGFPLGAMNKVGLAAEARAAVVAGAAELDMVIPVGLVRGSQSAEATDYVRAVRDVAPDIVLKVIVESALLSDAEIVLACEVAEQAGADFVKTSTGFNAAGGATVEAVMLMRRTVGDRLGVKASGGIRTLADVEAMVDAGATRLGMSSTRAVLDEVKSA